MAKDKTVKTNATRYTAAQERITEKKLANQEMARSLGIQLTEDEKYDVDYIEDAINDMDSEEFSNLVQNASIGLVVKIAERGIQLAKEGGFDSFFKRSCVAKRLGKDDLFEV